MEAIVIKSIVFSLLVLAERPPPNSALTAFEQAPEEFLDTVKSPNLAALPNVDMVINSIILTFAGLEPPPTKPLTEDEHPESCSFASVKSPKS